MTIAHSQGDHPRVLVATPESACCCQVALPSHPLSTPWHRVARVWRRNDAPLTKPQGRGYPAADLGLGLDPRESETRDRALDAMPARLINWPLQIILPIDAPERPRVPECPRPPGREARGVPRCSGVTEARGTISR